MKINEIKQGGKVTITAIKGLQAMQFESKAVFGNEMGLFIEPIRYEGQLVSFDVSIYVMIEAVIVDVNDIPYRWKSVKIKTVEYNKEKYHLIISDDDVERMNRRNGYRLYLGIPGVAQLGANREAVDVIIKDISESGIGIVCEKDVEIVGKEIVHVNFRESKSGSNFNLNAVAVRKMTLPDERIIYGCKLLGESDKLRKFIMQRQREKIQRNKANNYKN